MRSGGSLCGFKFLGTQVGIVRTAVLIGIQNSLNISASETIDTYVYRYGLEMGQYSFATAVSLLKGVISIVLVLLTNGYFGILKKEYGSYKKNLDKGVRTL